VGQGIEDVGHGHNSARHRDLVPAQALGVAVSVPAFVVGQGNLLGQAQDVKAAPAQNSGADDGVGLNNLEFFRGKGPGLEQNAVGDGDLADVVKGRRSFKKPNGP
jgi:hypothetical protein